MTESRVSKSWIETTMAEADAKYAAAYSSSDVYHAPRPVLRAEAELHEPEAEAVAPAEESDLPRPVRRTGWRARLRNASRASGFMVVGAGLMLGLVSFSQRPDISPAIAPEPIQDPLAMLASLAPRFTSGEVVLPDEVALDALENQLDSIRLAAFENYRGTTASDTSFVTRVYGGVFTVAYDSTVLIGPPGSEPSLVSFNRSQNGLFGGHIDGEYVTMRVGDVAGLDTSLPEGCTLALASLQVNANATFLLRCR